MTVDTSRLQSETRSSLSHVLSQMLPYLGMFVIVLVLWLPFSFKTTGLVDEWRISLALDRGQYFFTVPNSDMSISRGRPLQLFFYALAHAFDSNSFLYYNIFLMFFFFGKLIISYWLTLEFLPGQMVLAFLMGVLFVLYPADSGLFSLNTLNIHSTVLIYLIATHLLILFRKQSGRLNYLALLGSAFFLFFGMLQYPGIITIAAVTPFFLLYFGRPNRRFWISTGIWYVTMSITLLYSNWAIRQAATSDSYDENFLQKVSFSLSELKSMVQAVVLAYERQISSWSNVIGKLNYLSFFWVFVVLGVVITGVIGWLLLRQQAHQKVLESLSWQRFVLLWIAGFVIFGIGIALYIPVPSLRFQDFRVFNVAALGSTMVLVLTLYLISGLFPRYRQSILLGLALPFVALALLSALQQHQQFVNYSLEEQNVLQQITAQAPQIAPDTVLVVVDRTGALNNEKTFQFGIQLQTALRFIYANFNIEAYYCPVEGSTVVGTNCSFKENGLQATISKYTKPPTVIVPYERLMLFATEYDGQVKLLTTEEISTTYKVHNYDPESHIIGGTIPSRVATLFSCMPALFCYRSTPAIVSNVFDLAVTDEIGLGWRASEPDGNGGAFRWSVNRKSTVDINMTTNTNLELEFKVLHWIDDDVINSLKLSVNGQNIPLTFSSTEQSSRIYHATIPLDVIDLQRSNLRLMFSVDHLSHPTEDQTIGFALNSLLIRPT